MTKQYLDKRDTDYVRDNLIFNYILGNEQELLIKSFVRNNGIELGFDPQCFYFLITGSHKKYTPPFTPDSFTSGVTNVYAIYDIFSDALHRFGYTGRAFQIKEDNSKQFGVLFSSDSSCSIPPDEMAQHLYDAYKSYSNREAFSSTSFVGPYNGYEQIHQAFLDARELNDLLFFGVRDQVITREFRNRTARPCDIAAILANVRRLTTTLCAGTMRDAIRQIEYLIDDMVAPSYSYLNFAALCTAVDDVLGMFETVYPERVRLEHRAQKSFFTLEQYKAWLSKSLCALYDQLKNARRHSPTLLMVLSFINRNYTTDLSLTQLAEYAYTNASTLSSEFNNELGMSFSEYVTGLRIRKAQQLLRETGMSVPEIAEAAGFSGAKYFREIFKKQIGMSPQQYRNQ